MIRNIYTSSFPGTCYVLQSAAIFSSSPEPAANGKMDPGDDITLFLSDLWVDDNDEDIDEVHNFSRISG